ncbi:MAG: c-type cytochrome [Rhodospirillaceae bacterium]|mgnify:FL=1|jgi:cytochrome c2|nr:c-type cytochrome [Rhodospirillaceae bacterium]MBT4117533.1 c-type cytochrome [Rhodospirillaceae bacterium]MBT4670636.1 c-type cytochrome [Rhodospirillaceae bacterium]MBT4721103.1 c-type cytochrome [Rhodospirillaceae bacterium]MBT4749881.1 c-type cytochrome [Rhodospirillaceae bacterium]
MKKFLTMVFFSLLVIGFFAGFSNFGVPRIEPAPPPVEEKLDLSAMTMPQFVALGEKLFKGKGTCTLCHSGVGGRAPLLGKSAVVAAARLKEARYKGEAKDVQAYLLESMVKPSAYVVAGFGKKGTQDAESPMPDVSAGSIRMNEAEIAAVIAYLQDLAGVDISVKIPEGAGDAGEDSEEDSGGRKPFSSAAEIIEEMSCGACHKVADAEGETAPDLRKLGARRGKAHIRRSILDPNAEISQGFEPDLMPPDYGEQLFAKELEMLVEYLAGLK